MGINPKFVKLMMMTTSTSDGEALTAIRKANAFLAEADVNWEEFLGAVETTKERAAKAEANAFRTPPSKRKKAQPDDPFSDIGRSTPNRYDDPDDINRLFELAFDNAGSGGFREFLESVHEWWEEKGFLTKKQYEAVQQAAES